MSDESELPFTLFIATAQLIVGLGLLIVGTSSAVRIIGGVIVLFALLTGGSALYGARRRSRLQPPRLAEPGGTGSPSSHGPRQPPNPEASRSASAGPHVPGA